MDNIIKCDDVTPDAVRQIQRLACTLNNDPLSFAAVDFDSLRTFTNGFEAGFVVLFLVNIVSDNLREYLRDTIFDAIRMDNELLSSDMRMNDEVLENRLNEIWRQVTVKLHYAEKQKARRNATLRTMLNETPPSYTNTPPPSPPLGRRAEIVPTVHLIINNNNSNNQSGDDKRQIALSGNDSTYNENIKK